MSDPAYDLVYEPRGVSLLVVCWFFIWLMTLSISYTAGKRHGSQRTAEALKLTEALSQSYQRCVDDLETAVGLSRRNEP